MEIKKIIFKKKMLGNELEQVYDILKDLEPRDYHYVLKQTAKKRPWRPKRNGWANVLDQVLHAIYGLVLLLPILLLNSYWGAALVGFIAGSIREIEQFYNQDLKIRMIFDRLVDITFFVLGAVTIYHFLQ
jgi:hypothetical protein